MVLSRPRSAPQVADHLARQGFQSVFNVAGGITAFSQRVDTSVPVY